MQTLSPETVLASAQPPALSSQPAIALWHVEHGDWDRAHQIVQALEEAGDRDAAWVHAHLHRVEGDLSNAGYWYRQARRPTDSGPLDVERRAILADLLARDP